MGNIDPVKINGSADVKLDSKDLPGIIKAFQKMDYPKTKMLYGTAITITLIISIALIVIVAFIVF